MIKNAHLVKLAETFDSRAAGTDILYNRRVAVINKFAQSLQSMDDLISKADNFAPNDESLANAFTRFVDKYIALEQALDPKFVGKEDEKDMIGIYQTLDSDYNRVMSNQYIDSEEWDEDFTSDQFTMMLETMMDAAKQHIESIADMSVEDASNIYFTQEFNEHGQKGHEDTRDEVQDQMFQRKIRQNLESRKQWARNIKFDKTRRDEFAAKRRSWANGFREELKNDPNLSEEYAKLKAIQKEKSKVHRKYNVYRTELVNKIKSTNDPEEKENLKEELRKFELDVKRRKRITTLDQYGRETDDAEVGDDELDSLMKKMEDHELKAKQRSQKVEEVKSKSDFDGLIEHLRQKANSMVSDCKKEQKIEIDAKIISMPKGIELKLAKQSADQELAKNPSPAAQSAKKEADGNFAKWEMDLVEKSPIYINTKENVGHLSEFRNKLVSAKKEGVLDTKNQSDTLQMLIAYGKSLIVGVSSMYGGKAKVRNLTATLSDIVKQLEALYL